MARKPRGHRCPPPEWPPQGPGIVYLIHFARPYRHARHYLGYTTDLEARLAAHAAGRGARLMEVIRATGIRWRLVRVWGGDRDLERRLKKWGGAARHCPVCRAQHACQKPRTATSPTSTLKET